MIRSVINRFSLPIKKLGRYVFFKRRFKDIFHLLEEGDYYINLKKSTIVKKSCLYLPIDVSKKFWYIQELFSVSSGNLFLGRVKNGKTSKHEDFFHGSYVLFSNKLKTEVQYGELKVFNLNQEKVLSTFNTIDSFEKKLSNTIYFSKHFFVPRILQSSETDLYIVEELIDFHKPAPNEYIILANYTLTSYKSYFASVNGLGRNGLVGDILNYNKLENSNQETIDLISSYINFETLPENLMYIYQHGDLSLSNILIDNQAKIFFIDFEHSGYFSFLYDIMWFWQNEAINNNDFSIIEYYFKGGFDENLAELFLACNTTFNKSNKLDYLLIVILEVIQKRVLKEKPELRNDFLNNKILKAIRRIVEISENKI